MGTRLRNVNLLQAIRPDKLEHSLPPTEISISGAAVLLCIEGFRTSHPFSSFPPSVKTSSPKPIDKARKRTIPTDLLLALLKSALPLFPEDYHIRHPERGYFPELLPVNEAYERTIPTDLLLALLKGALPLFPGLKIVIISAPRRTIPTGTIEACPTTLSWSEDSHHIRHPEGGCFPELLPIEEAHKRIIPTDLLLAQLEYGVCLTTFP
ncbi:uncharacterized protein FTJAE_12562 [Fusarium tjaetaba]|uniref:Uncharacterized protein n=1 Tax=Fusarium tjaetaba TaxID=1567544 RepID=A0A8H5VDW0_9HYPO|nr:uncharacterized protein FTJAE_12562 [Fusarium tjaetaba]KAF5617614.1 hypothetical protein FTJAE_12562 [Fusarium tjaetaba]